MEGIRICREAAGLNQSELARRLKISSVAVNKMERPGFYPATARLPEIADVLGCSIDALFGRGAGRPWSIWEGGGGK